MICSGEKTKLLVVGTKELRAAKLIDERALSIEVCDQKIVETKDEKLLGVIMSIEQQPHLEYTSIWK